MIDDLFGAIELTPEALGALMRWAVAMERCGTAMRRFIALVEKHGLPPNCRRPGAAERRRAEVAKATAEFSVAKLAFKNFTAAPAEEGDRHGV